MDDLNALPFVLETLLVADLLALEFVSTGVLFALGPYTVLKTGAMSLKLLLRLRLFE